MTTHPYPQHDWRPCNEPPDDCRRVLIWHRVRPYCRFYRAVVGWWNSEEWLRDSTDEHPHAFTIYQPVLWRDIERWQTPFGFPTFDEKNK